MQELYEKYKTACFEICDLFYASHKWEVFVRELRRGEFRFPEAVLKQLGQEFMRGLLESYCDIQLRSGGTPPEELPEMTLDGFAIRLLVVKSRLNNILLISEIEEITEEKCQRAINAFWDDLEPAYKKDSDGQDIQ